MPRSFAEYQASKKASPDYYSNRFVKQLDYLEANLKTAIETLNQEATRDKERIAELQAMVTALRGLGHPGALTFSRTTEGFYNTVCSLRDFLEKNGARNYRLLKQTVQAHPEHRALLDEQDRGRTLNEQLVTMDNVLNLEYGAAMKKHYEEDRRELFEANVGKNLQFYRDYTVKQIRYLEELMRLTATDVDTNRQYSDYYSSTLKAMADALHSLGNTARFAYESVQVEQALDTLRRLPDFLTENQNYIAGKLQERAVKEQELQNMLPQMGAYLKKGPLGHIADLDSFLDLNFEQPLQTLLFDENERLAALRTEQEERAEEEAKKRDAEAEEAEIRAAQQFEEDQRKRAEEEAARKQQEKEAQIAAAAARKEFREQNGALAIPEEFHDLDVAGMLVNAAKENGPQYQALVKFAEALEQTIRQWEQFYTDNYPVRMNEAMAQLPEEAPEEQRNPAIGAALDAVSTAEKQRYLSSSLQDEYEQRLAQEKARLGEGATEEQAVDSLYRRQLTTTLRDSLRNESFSKEAIENARKNAPLTLAAAKREGMSEEERSAFKENTTQIRNRLTAERIKKAILEAYATGPANLAFMNREFPDQESREQFFEEFKHEKSLADNRYTQDYVRREEALYQFRMNQLLDYALHDEQKWNELNRTLSELNELPDSLKALSRDKLLDELLESTRTEAAAQELEAEAERQAMEELAETFSQEEIERQADLELGLPKSDSLLLYDWAREQKQQEVERQLRQEQAQAFPGLAGVGIDKAKALSLEMHRILIPLRELLPTQQELNPPAFNYLYALDSDTTLRADFRRELRRAYHKYQQELQENGGKPRQNVPEPDLSHLSVIDQRRERARIREEKDWRRKVIRDIEERRVRAEEEHRRGIDVQKNRKIDAGGQFLDLACSVSRLRNGLRSAPSLGLPQDPNANEADRNLNAAFNVLDESWTVPELNRGKELRDRELRYTTNAFENRRAQLRGRQGVDLLDAEPNAQAPGGQQEENGEELFGQNDALNYTVVDDLDLYQELHQIEQHPQWKDREWGPYVFQAEYRQLQEQKQQQAQKEMQNKLLDEQNGNEIQQNQEPIGNPPPVNQEHGQANEIENAGEVKIEDALNEQQPQNQQEPQPQAPEEAQSASRWIKKIRRDELFTTDPETGNKKLSIRALSRILAVRLLADSVRHDKARLLEKQLTDQQIRAGITELTKCEEFRGFISKLEGSDALKREAISVVGKGHGGGLDDMFGRYLAETAKPGELLCSDAARRWAPTAIQRIEAMQKLLREDGANPQKMQTAEKRRCLAEIIAAREMVDARRGGPILGAHENLYKKLSDPEKHLARVRDVEACLTMMNPEKVAALLEKATDGHGGAMLEDYKKLNTVKAHLKEIQETKAARDEARRIDPAIALALLQERGRNNGDKQLEFTQALRTAEGLRQLPGYTQFANSEERQQDLLDGDLLKLNTSFHPLIQPAQQGSNGLALNPNRQALIQEGQAHQQEGVQHGNGLLQQA